MSGNREQVVKYRCPLCDAAVVQQQVEFALNVFHGEPASVRWKDLHLCHEVISRIFSNSSTLLDLGAVDVTTWTGLKCFRMVKIN